MSTNRIGIIGNGNVGSALMRGVTGTAHEVKTAGNDPAAIRETAAWASHLIIAVPFGAIDDVVRTIGETLDGKTVIDVTNAIGGFKFLHG